MARVRVDINQAGIAAMVQPGSDAYRHIDRVGSVVSTVAKLKVGVDTGRLRQAINHRVIVRKTQVTARIQARPKYAKIHHEGRRAIEAAPGRVLRFRAKDGTIVYTKRVKGVAPNPFLTDAVKEVTGKTPQRRDTGPGA